MSYSAPVRDVSHILNHILELDDMIQNGMVSELDQQLATAILDEAGKFAAERLAPLNHKGDQQGCTLKNGEVTTPEGWGEAYTDWREAGWAALSAHQSFGGQALPQIIAQAVGEFWNSANLAFGLCPLLTQGAVDAITHHASNDLKTHYLPKMVSGEWAGTMNLTEPQAGSDLSAIRTKASPAANGTYSISGTKIFITYGEHELTENIIHLVLARLPDAPEGTRGISLFLVPKFLLNDDGTPGKRNDLVCSGIEKKLGIHASPTCVMTFGPNEGAEGYLVGEENRGLQAMFTMMNLARLSVGTQGVAIMERSTQAALDYAAERLQGNAPASPKGAMDPIIKHPDIRSQLSEMQATTQACRAICLLTAKYIDMAEYATDDKEQQAAARMAALLTPIAKAFSTDRALDITSKGVQIHGGMGFIEETGAAQHYRDARILPIYEGTNGIQAIDFISRKLPMEDGKTITALLAELTDISGTVKDTPKLAELVGDNLDNAIENCAATLTALQERGANDPSPHLYAATLTLELFGKTLGPALLLKGAVNAIKESSPDERRQWALAAGLAGLWLPQTGSLKRQILHLAKNGASLTAEIL